MVCGFSSPDYQRMKSFDGQNRLIIYSHTNVSATFSLFSSNQFRPHMSKNCQYPLYPLILFLNTRRESIFVLPISSYVTNSVLNESYSFLWPLLVQSIVSTDPLKGHIGPTADTSVASQWSSEGKYKVTPKRKGTISCSNISTVQPEITQEVMTWLMQHLFPLCCIIGVEKLK